MSKGGKITQFLEVELLQIRTAFPENVPKTSQNKKKFRSNASIDDDIQFQSTSSCNTCYGDLVDLSPTAKLQ